MRVSESAVGLGPCLRLPDKEYDVTKRCTGVVGSVSACQMGFEAFEALIYAEVYSNGEIVPRGNADLFRLVEAIQ